MFQSYSTFSRCGIYQASLKLSNRTISGSGKLISGRDSMFTRRSFLKGMGTLGAGGLVTASFDEHGMARALDAVRFVSGRTPQEIAMDEDFWFEIQRAFTVDRTLINLNNGGVCPSPRVVQEAMRRYLEFSNQAPVYT